MEPTLLQSIRHKLQKRINRLNSIDSPESFVFSLWQFWRFFDQQPTFNGIIQELLARFTDLEESVDKIFKGEWKIGETEEEAAAIGYKVLRRLDHKNIYGMKNTYFNVVKNDSDTLDIVRELFLEPFYEYVDEQLDDQRALLALLLRYKHRSEWFYKKRLWELSQTEKSGENSLKLDLYSYLYDQGIDFSIEPSSITGEIDLIAAQNTSDPLLLEAKIFDGDGRGKSYIKKAFNQIYTYTQQYNEPFGYLVIYKIIERDLNFSLKTSRDIPQVNYNHKTIFLLTIDIYPHDKPVSQRPPLNSIEITEEELIGFSEERNNTSS